MAKQAHEIAGFQTEYAYRKARRQAQQWSDKHSKQSASYYDARGRHRDPREFRRYYDAFVSAATGTAFKTENPAGHLSALDKYFRANPDLIDEHGRSYSGNPYRALV